jgi:RHH-type proline utilization regulon transcriptional repressor/proline dehydrogenase/delta 1-pyrroline-5-carboxylate dehydrogenase
MDFSLPEERKRLREAVAAVRESSGREYPAVIGGHEIFTGHLIRSVNPARPDETVGHVSAIDRETAGKALYAAREAQPAWANAGYEQRACVLVRAADLARGKRHELMAWQIMEGGKNWVEADADVCEAIDFLEYYSQEMLRLGAPVSMGLSAGEENRYLYRPGGVGLVIAPWNFPLAISMGMVSAALVAGNAVLYKPSSLTPVNGWLVYSIFRDAGVPEGVLNFIPGSGAGVGDHLVEHELTDLIAFTGSREVGLGIVERAGRTRPGQAGIKRVIAEMGGKNAIIVDADADLDLAVTGVLRSSFGYQGQKCSACSRVIVLRDCYDRFLERLVEAVRGIAVGSPEDPAFFMGPVIDENARRKIQRYVRIAKEEGRVQVEVPVPDSGFYVPPVVITDLPSGSRVLREEIFGPVLSVIMASDIDEAVETANRSEFGLTGGVYSRSPAHIRLASQRLKVGNLYINRGITGAVVGRQPFGGIRMSGTGSKAGGPDYLRQFMWPAVITENTVRRGFAPDVAS